MPTKQRRTEGHTMHGSANRIDERCSHVAFAGHFFAAAAGADPASWRRSKLPLRASRPQLIGRRRWFSAVRSCQRNSCDQTAPIAPGRPVIAPFSVASVWSAIGASPTTTAYRRHRRNSDGNAKAEPHEPAFQLARMSHAMDLADSVRVTRIPAAAARPLKRQPRGPACRGARSRRVGMHKRPSSVFPEVAPGQTR